MLIHINAKKLRMSILFCNFVVEKVIITCVPDAATSPQGSGKNNMEPIYYMMKIEWNHDFLLERAIRKEMQSLWKLSCFMAPRIKTDNHYWSEEIDYLADIMLQIYNHNNK